MNETYSTELADKLIIKWKPLVIGKKITFGERERVLIEISKLDVGDDLFEVKIRDNTGISYQLNDIVFKTDLINFINNPPI